MNNLDLMRKRFEWQGGIEQENRMIKDKFRTLQKALLYSYQACTVSIVQSRNSCPYYLDSEEKNPDYRALINPDKVKQDYDDKIISIPYENGFQPGDIFEWRKTNTKWIIYLEEITEDAYFRGEIRRCRHQIKFKDKEGNWRYTWAAIRGPVETQIDSIQKNQERIDKPNLTLNILIPQNEETIELFDRYAEFIFAGRSWQVQAPDSISMRGILEINAREDYFNKDTDDMKNEIKDGLVIEPIDPTPESAIDGETFIKPGMPYAYTIDTSGGSWCIVEKDFPIKLCISKDSTKVMLTWEKMKSGQCTLRWTKDQEVLEKVIVVESLY